MFIYFLSIFIYCSFIPQSELASVRVLEEDAEVSGAADFGMRGAGCPGAGRRVPGAERRAPGAGRRVPGAGCAERE